MRTPVAWSKINFNSCSFYFTSITVSAVSAGGQPPSQTPFLRLVVVFHRCIDDSAVPPLAERFDGSPLAGEPANVSLIFYSFQILAALESRTYTASKRKLNHSHKEKNRRGKYWEAMALLAGCRSPGCQNFKTESQFRQMHFRYASATETILGLSVTGWFPFLFWCASWWAFFVCVLPKLVLSDTWRWMGGGRKWKEKYVYKSFKPFRTIRTPRDWVKNHPGLSLLGGKEGKTPLAAAAAFSLMHLLATGCIVRKRHCNIARQECNNVCRISCARTRKGGRRSDMELNLAHAGV